LLDLIKGTNVRSTKHFLDQSQYWAIEQLEAYQLQKLKDLLAEVRVNVPFYRDLYNRQAVEEISSLRRLGDLPICDRKMTIEATGGLLNGPGNPLLQPGSILPLLRLDGHRTWYAGGGTLGQ
jgi:phenylacetate-coenzyme A ligase PaaK-like adenylate-forming protein